MSKVVFVGNVPYNMGEEQLIDVFKSVGQVIGFRLVFDRDTGKPRGYGFCEFADHETAMSAVRNLNNVEVGGRPLRIDLADSDPFLEGKTTVRGELLDGGFPGPSEPRSGWRPSGGGGRGHDIDAFMVNIPHGKPVPKGTSALDAITHTLADIPPNQLMEVLAQMKAFVITHPDQARSLLVRHPQLAYALFQALMLCNIYNPEALLRIPNTRSAPAGPVADIKRPPPPTRTPPITRPPMSAPPPHLQHPPHYPPHPPPHGMPPFPPSGMQPPQSMPMGPPMSAPPPVVMYGQPPPSMQPPPMMPPYYRGPPPPQPAQVSPPMAPPAPVPQSHQQPPAAPPPPEISDSQRAMLMQVLSMSQEQINALPETERSAIMQLRTQFMNGLGS